MGGIRFKKLIDLGDRRLKDMDGAGVDIQVLSLSSPGLEQLDPEIGTPLARQTNDLVAKAMNRHPDRFLGFAALAPNDPEAASDELERAVRELGMVGWNTHANYGDFYLDNKKYWPILERAAGLRAPIYLHPTVPNCPHMSDYGTAMASAAFGFGVETAHCMMRLIYSGVFDRYPGLTFFLGHLGEAFPFLLRRMDFVYLKPAYKTESKPSLKKKPSDYIKENVYITTSGNYFEPAFMCAFQAVGPNRIFLGTDYPYEESSECIEFLEGLSISQADKNRIYFENSRQLGIGVG
jgi:predicted TIM-barrel fold metal-dependent hydrolase